jgi:hypothetical protein
MTFSSPDAGKLAEVHPVRPVLGELRLLLRSSIRYNREQGVATLLHSGHCDE